MTTGLPTTDVADADLATDLRDASALLGRPLRRVRVLSEARSAPTQLATDGETELVVRGVAAGDPVLAHEVDVLARAAPLGSRVPTVLAVDLHRDRPLLVTTRVPGAPPAPQASGVALAAPLAVFLAELHALEGDGSGAVPGEVLSHGDYRAGSTLWSGLELTGVSDWSAARTAPRGLDLARCRLDLVLLGDPGAADVLVARYERAGGLSVPDLADWDRQAAACADPLVESWAGDFAALGRRHLTAARLRQRLDAWTARLEAAA